MAQHENEISISEKILKRETTFLKFVESLETKLVNPNVSQREEAIKQLTDVLLLMPPDFLSETEVSTLVRFFSVRLSDSVLLTSSCLKSLNFLSHCDNFPNDSVQTILSSLFKEQMVQALTQADRFLIFSLIKFFIDNKLENLKTMDAEFVLGFIYAADGEKDPRNLMLIFDCFLKIANEIPLGSLAEDMFQLVACYFPVNFKPPSDEPYSVRAEQLSSALHDCLTANSVFAEFCYELLKVELEENKIEDRVAVLTLLSKALIAFPPTITAECSNRIWQEIRKICVTSKNQSDVEHLALQCLRNLIIALLKCSSPEGRNSALTSVLGQISKDCEHFLTNVELQLYDIGNKILLAVAETDGNICSRLAANVLILLMEKYQTHIPDAAKVDYLNFLCDWVFLLGNFRKNEILNSMKSSLSALLCDRIFSSNQNMLIAIGIKICVKLIEIENDYFTDDQLTTVFRQRSLFVDEEKTHSVDQPLWKQSVSFLQVLALKRLDFVMKHLDEMVTDLNHKEVIYAILIVSKDAVDKFLPELLKFTTLNEDMFHCLDIFVNEILNVELLDVVCRPLCRKLLDCAIVCVNNASNLTKNHGEIYETLSKLGNVLQDIFVLLPENAELEIFNIFVDQLKAASTCATPWILCCEKLIVALSENNVENAIWFVEAASSYVIGFDYNNDFKQIPFVQSWARCLAALLNKLPQTSTSLNILTDVYIGQLESKFWSNDCAVDSFSLVTKALLTRNLSPLCTNCLTKLIGLLNSDLSEKVAKSLELIVVDDPRLLSVKTKVKRTFLYKQRIFVQFVQILTEIFKKADKTDWKKNYFRILSILLANTPKEIQSSAEFKKLIPLLISSIDSEDLEILMPSVNSILHLLTVQGAVDQLQVHLPSLTQRLCKLAQWKWHMELQQACLQCLSKIIGLVNPAVLNPWREQILRSLAVCLDDPKRLVRREAVCCRNRWLLLT